MPTPSHTHFYRVTSHAKAMEDAVEIGLRSAFNEVGFASFGKVLPGLKLRGEHPQASHGIGRVTYLHHLQQENRLYRTTSPMNSTNSSRRLSVGTMLTLART